MRLRGPEAAAVGALGSIILAAAYRSLTWDKLRESVYLTARTTAMVCWLFVGSFRALAAGGDLQPLTGSQSR